MDYTVHRSLQARILEWVAFSFSRGSSQPRDQTQVSRITGGFFTSCATTPKSTGVGSLSLLQWIFLTQESNQGLLHCRQVLYQLSYKGSPAGKLANSQRYFKYQLINKYLLNTRRKWQPTPVVLPGESRGQRSLAGYSPWGHKESDTTEQLTHTP